MKKRIMITTVLLFLIIGSFCSCIKRETAVGVVNVYEEEQMYKEWTTKFKKNLGLSASDYYEVNLNEYDDQIHEGLTDEEVETLYPVFLDAYYDKSYDRISPGIIFISKEYSEIIICFEDDKGNQISHYLQVDDEGNWGHITKLN